MKHIFYFVGIMFIIHEILWIINPYEKVEKTKRLKELRNQFTDKNWDEYSDEFKNLLINVGIPSLLFTLWIFLGLLSFNWVAFLFIIVVNFVIILPISKFLNFNKFYVILHWINSLIGLFFGTFIIINSYHLKLNLFDIVNNWLFLK